MLASRKRSTSLFLIVLVFLSAIWYHTKHGGRIYQEWLSSIESRPVKLPANRTLGFGAVLAVSKGGSGRRHSLLQAANVTDFDITIPKQPDWTEGQVHTFINGQTGAQRGSILAWLGHRNALRWFLDSGAETALILEDDVDWDIRLRSVQIPLAASAARQLLPPSRSDHPLANPTSNHTQYWGNHDAWDLLYLGHCGDYWDEVSEYGPKTNRQSFNLSALPHAIYRDPTVPLRGDLHPFTQSLFHLLKLPEHSRVMHRSKFPLCSFGYAVTRPAAKRLLDDLAPAQYSEKGARAFDVALLLACNQGENVPSIVPNTRKPHHFRKTMRQPEQALREKKPTPGLRCWTLNSELFHHMPGTSQVDEIGQKSGEKPGIPPVDLAGQAQIVSRNETTNIDCGFWSGDFAFADNDTDTLHYLQEQVGRQGRCIKNGREEQGQNADATQIPLA
ncbi:hypothetical protein ACN47E_004386 [Coniothyrium glycines]